jgi:alpha-N-acetylglucosamine transferase
MIKRGIVLIATGHPYYGRYALNLAMSLKNLCDIHITLLASISATSHITEELNRFDKILYLREDEYAQPTKAKLLLYENSPYEQTIYLDVDIISLTQNPITKLFDELDSLNFTTISEGYNAGDTNTMNAKYPLWADMGDIRKSYSIDADTKVYKTRSEFIYFRKCKEVKKYFDTAKKIYEKPKVITASYSGGSVPDEFAFNVAGALTGIYPHAENWTPVYWAWEHDKKKLKRHDIIAQYYGYSLGGNRNLTEQAKFYNDLANFHAKKAGLKYPMLAKDKLSFLPERHKV